MNNYELVCILDPQVGDNRFDEVVEKYESYLKSNGAEIAHVDRWGLRKLAYTSPSLKKRRQGYYVLYQFTAEPTLINPLEQDLRLDEGVLRHLVVSVKGEFLRVPELAPDTILETSGPPRDRERGRPSDRPPRSARREGEDEEKKAGGDEESAPAKTEAAEEASAQAAEAKAEDES